MTNKIQCLLAMAAAATMMGFFTSNAAAQNDAAQFRERALARYREQLDVKSDEDWKKIEPLVGKVMDARTSLGGFGFGRGGGRTRGTDGDNADQDRFRLGSSASPEEKALAKAIEAKAPADEIKSKLVALREARKSKEADYEKAQDELRKALSPRQEAAAVLVRLLK